MSLAKRPETRAKRAGYHERMPKHWARWAGGILYAYLLIDVFRRIDAASHSVSDTLIAFALPFIALSCLFLLMLNLQKK
jgi:hypothetical protein